MAEFLDGGANGFLVLFEGTASCAVTAGRGFVQDVDCGRAGAPSVRGIVVVVVNAAVGEPVGPVGYGSNGYLHMPNDHHENCQQVRTSHNISWN